MRLLQSVVLAVVASGGCSRELGPDHYSGARTHSERIQKKAEYVKSLTKEGPPIPGWVAVPPAGEERAWGVVREGMSDLATSPFEDQAVVAALASCQIITVDVLYAPADSELEQLARMASRLISLVFAKRSSDANEIEDSISQEILRMRKTVSQNGHLVSHFDKFESPLHIPKFSITRKRERASVLLSLIDRINQQYGQDIPVGQLLVGDFEIPVRARNRPYTLRATLIHDAPNKRWVFAKFVMTPYRSASNATASMKSLESDIEASLSADRKAVEYLGIDYFSTPLAELNLQ